MPLGSFFIQLGNPTLPLWYDIIELKCQFIHCITITKTLYGFFLDVVWFTTGKKKRKKEEFLTNVRILVETLNLWTSGIMHLGPSFERCKNTFSYTNSLVVKVTVYTRRTTHYKQFMNCLMSSLQAQYFSFSTFWK